jgi:Cytochrome C oxidase, cbb3-type, subunit III
MGGVITLVKGDFVMHDARCRAPADAEISRRVPVRQTARRPHTLVVAVVASLLLPAVSGPAAAQRARVIADGQEDYEQHCAACHGPSGVGDGSMAEILVIPPPDLTRIAGRNDGEFPFWEIYAIIEGEEKVKGHDTFQMPLGQQRFERDESKPGFLPAHIRVLQLTHFLESLQKQ